MQNNYSNQNLEYAGFWVRLAAYCIDSIVVFAGLLVVRLVLVGISRITEGTVLGGNILFHYTLTDIVLYIFHALYFIVFTCYTGTTLGKKAMNLRVVRADGSQKLGIVDVVYRETIGRFLCSISIGIGYMMAGVDKEKRGLHDMLCDTRVIYAKRIKVYPVHLMQGQQAPAYVQPGQLNHPPVQGQQMQKSPQPPQYRPPRAPDGPYSMVLPDHETQERDS